MDSPGRNAEKPGKKATACWTAEEREELESRALVLGEGMHVFRRDPLSRAPLRQRPGAPERDGLDGPAHRHRQGFPAAGGTDHVLERRVSRQGELQPCPYRSLGKLRRGEHYGMSSARGVHGFGQRLKRPSVRPFAPEGDDRLERRHTALPFQARSLANQKTEELDGRWVGKMNVVEDEHGRAPARHVEQEVEQVPEKPVSLAFSLGHQ